MLLGVRPATAEPINVVYDASAPLRATVNPLGGTAYHTYAVRYRGANTEMVPGLLTLPKPGKAPAPCVLLLHGLGGSKGNMFLPAIALARRGFASFAIDIAGQGERQRLNEQDTSATPLAETRLAILQTVVDLRRAVDFAETRPEIDRHRIGFLGVSLGGMIGTVFAAEEPRVRAVVLWSAGGDWGKLVTGSRHAFASRLRATGQTDAAAIEAQMRDVDPARFAGRLSPRPLLLFVGAQDTVIPPPCGQALYDAARQPKRLITLPGGHVPDPVGMLDQSLTWLERILRAPPLHSVQRRDPQQR